MNLSTITVYGSGFNYPFGALALLGGVITGNLQDGTAVNLSFAREATANIILSPVPEPSSWAIAATSAALVFAAAAGRLRRIARRK